MTLPEIAGKYRRSLIVFAVLLLVILWLASGPGREVSTDQASATQPMTVVTVASEARPVNRRLVLQGDLEPSQTVGLRARTGGRIEALPVAQGREVTADTIIARIAMDDRHARLRRAEAQLKRSESDYQATKKMVEQGHQSRLQLEAAEAALEAARAELETVQLDIDNTRMRTPMAGILDTLHVEAGDYIAVGERVADIIENNPLTAVVNIPQQHVQQLKKGMEATVHFAGGEPRQGSIEYIASRADTGTRTFRTEITVDNPQRQLPSGISVRVEIATEEVRAHRVSPALISLDDRGELVVKSVDDRQRVRQHPVIIVRAEADHVWISGLPEQLRLITVGHGFVNAGEEVRVSEQNGQLDE